MTYDGTRDLLTIITEGEKDPVLMGFKLQGEEPPLFPDPERRVLLMTSCKRLRMKCLD